ncbi:ATP synthase F1 subunit epsilon [Candidatus Gottesmanbacteria bacterium]|nr:ATP synthase F1 subunit epsilon [Candidatus Gottesmanbacteria bacterium]MBI5465622.1 ATP synthase F1 subunit epsilon [Candidatus Gottesmanbacteria bacterium]
MLTFLLEILTPDRIAFSGQVEMVTAPSTTGAIGILPRHTPLFTRLSEGEVKIVKDGQDYYLAIGGGFLEVTPEKVIILVTEAYHVSEINEQEVLAAKRAAEEALASKPTGEALLSAQASFRRSLIALKILRRRRAPKIASLPSS